MYELIKFVYHSKIFAVVLILLLLYLYFKLIVYSYWKKHGIPHEKPTVPLGTLNKKFFSKKMTIGNALMESYEKFKNHPIYGLYFLHAPILMVNDLQLIKQILIKDFSNFVDRGSYSNPKVDPLGENLFFLKAESWKVLRTKLSPTFTSGKLKQMFPLIKDVSDDLVNAVDVSLESSEILQLKDLAQRFTIDTIFSLAFGVDSQTLKSPNNPFHYHGELSVKVNPFAGALAFFTPHLINKLPIPVLNPEASKFLIKLFMDMIEQRRDKNSKRNDFLNLLIELIDKEQIIDGKNMDPSLTSDINDELVKEKLAPLVAAAQAFAFFVAGHETTSSVISHCLYELALNPEVQAKLHDEIDNHLRIFKELNYQNINNLEYLDMVFYETLRKHSSLAFLNRTCVRDYKIPNSNYVVPKGMQVFISVSGIHYNPDFYPDPEKFDPMRFSKEIAATRDQLAFLGFGDGPRNCIGKRLGVIQSKVGLFALLSNYKFFVCDKTRIPAEYSLDSFAQTPKDGIHLRVERRKNKN